MRTIYVILAVALLVSVAADPCQAAGRRFFKGPVDPTPLPGDGQGSDHAPPGYPRYQYSKQVYPKYYYGFHSRQMQNIGVPTGDIGLRGNGIMYNPW